MQRHMHVHVCVHSWTGVCLFPNTVDILMSPAVRSTAAGKASSHCACGVLGGRAAGPSYLASPGFGGGRTEMAPAARHQLSPCS